MAALEVPRTLKYKGGQLNVAPVLEDFQDSPDGEENTRSSHEYLKDLEEEYQAKSLLAKSKRFFKMEVSSDDEETKVKALMAFTNEERIYVGKESARNGERTKITIKKVPLNKSQRNTTDPSTVVFDSPASDYDSADESSVCSTPLLLLKKLDGAKPSFGPKTIKSILKSKSTFKAETLKGIILNEPFLDPARGNKSSLTSTTNSAPAGKLKNVNVEDDPPLAMVMKELNELKLQISKKKSSYSRNKNTKQHTGQGESSSRSRPSRPSVSFPSYIHYGYNNHHSDDFLYYPTCEICGSYDHNTHDHNRIISQRRGINPRNPQHFTKNYETYGSHVHTTSDHNDIEWFKKRETPHAKKAKSLNALRSKTPTKRKWFPTIRYGEEVSTKETLRNSLFPSKWKLLMAQIIQCLRGHDVSADFIVKADPGLSTPNDYIPLQKGMDERTKNTSYDHISTGTDPRVLADQTKYSQKHKLELEKNKAEAEAALPKAQHLFPNVGEKDTNQATISQLFQRRAKKDAEAGKRNQKNQQPKQTTPPTTTLIITTHLQSLPKSSSQPEGEHIKKIRAKRSFLHKRLRKRLEEEAKAEAAKQEGEVRKTELIDLLGPEIVHKYYKYKLQYDRYCDLMLNRRAESRITNCDVLTKKGLITLKMYKEDGTSEVIPNFKASDMHLELGINLDILLSKQVPLDKLNDLANKKRKHADDIHDYFKANKRLKSSVQYEDHSPGTVLSEHVLGKILFNSHHRQDFVTIEDSRDFPNTMLYTIQEIFFRLHQGLRLDDHARTFSSLLLAEIDKRNLNPLKKMRTIEQLR
uniref:Uncharacterized protein n=1 Tax=Tanacetum cinerariifolium TaxID=118510 RepID=A0A6L2MY20_TANCI|nr:hypothetical protein [Tanacetum cinerariifolium]